MPGINTSGLPQTDDYNLGRGIVYFAPLSAGLPTAYRDMGNSPEFSISVETETLEHQSSRQGLKITDKEVLISQKISLSLTLDEINFDNLAVLLSGDAVAGTTPLPTISALLWIDLTPGVELGRWYDITEGASQSGDRLYDISHYATVVFTGSSAGVLTTVADYTLDEEMGRVFFLTNGTAGLADGESITLDTTTPGSPRDFDEVRALTKASVIGALKFISENPAFNDHQTEYQFHQVSLKAEGDFSLIGDEFTTMQFTAVAESNPIGGGVLSPTLTIRTLPPA